MMVAGNSTQKRKRTKKKNKKTLSQPSNDHHLDVLFFFFISLKLSSSLFSSPSTSPSSLGGTSRTHLSTGKLDRARCAASAAAETPGCLSRTERASSRASATAGAAVAAAGAIAASKSLRAPWYLAEVSQSRKRSLAWE